jgi:hypothetical protein
MNMRNSREDENKLDSPLIDIGAAEHEQTSDSAPHPRQQLCKHVGEHHP